MKIMERASSSRFVVGLKIGSDLKIQQFLQKILNEYFGKLQIKKDVQWIMWLTVCHPTKLNASMLQFVQNFAFPARHTAHFRPTALFIE